jgi:predicted ribosome quality control (RQC) complex YloA/Tae2 family protein
MREEREQDSLGELVRRRFWGVDTFVADRIQQEFEDSSGFSGDPDSAESRWGEFTAIVGYLRRAVDPRTRIELIPSGNGSEVAPRREGSEFEIFPTLTAALVARDNSFREESGRESQIALVSSALEKQLKRAQRRLAETQRAIDAAGEAETLKHQADLLGTQRHLMRRGMTEVSVADWKSGETMTLPLSGKLSPQDNIEEYYQRARKTIRAAENARRVLPELTAEVERLAGLRDELKSDDLPEERIAAISAEKGIAATSAKPAKRVQQPRLAYREFLINDFTILVGRSNRENDEVTFRVARPDDLFLHADQVSGSHVILRSKGRGMEFPKEMVMMAAQIAAHFSKARHSGLVSVIYTPIRHVSKPRKAPPGLVRVQREKSLMVRPLRPPGYRTGDD